MNKDTEEKRFRDAIRIAVCFSMLFLPGLILIIPDSPQFVVTIIGYSLIFLAGVFSVKQPN